MARQSLEDCQRMAVILAEHHCDTREAGQLYAAWTLFCAFWPQGAIRGRGAPLNFVKLFVKSVTIP
jgi:hypothetical protein